MQQVILYFENCEIFFDLYFSYLRDYKPTILEKIIGHSHFLALRFFTTSETKLDCYQQKVSVRVASQFVKHLRTYDPRKLENFTRIPEMLGPNGEYPAAQLSGKF